MRDGRIPIKRTTRRGAGMLVQSDTVKHNISDIPERRAEGQEDELEFLTTECISRKSHNYI